MSIPSVMRLRLASGCAAVLLSFSACAILVAPPRPGQQVATAKDLPLDTIVVVGRIELRPPIGKGEQELHTTSGYNLRNAFILFAGDRLRDLAEIDSESFDGSYLTVFDQEFFIAVHRSPILFLSGGAYCTRFDPPAPAEYRILTTPFRIALLAADEAVYVGTIQIYRDENSAVKSILIRDDYQWADILFRDRFGTSRTLRKALAEPVL